MIPSAKKKIQLRKTESFSDSPLRSARDSPERPRGDRSPAKVTRSPARSPPRRKTSPPRKAPSREPAERTSRETRSPSKRSQVRTGERKATKANKPSSTVIASPARSRSPTAKSPTRPATKSPTPSERGESRVRFQSDEDDWLLQQGEPSTQKDPTGFVMPRDPTVVPSRTETLKAPTWGPYELAGLPRKPGIPPKPKATTTLPPMTAIAPRIPSIQSSEQLTTLLSSSLSADSIVPIAAEPKALEPLPPTEPPENVVSIASGAQAEHGMTKAEVRSLHDERRAEATGLQRRLDELGSQQQEAIHVYSEQGKKIDSLGVTVSEVLEANQKLIKDNTVTTTAMKEMADKHRALQAMLATVQSRAEAWREQVEASVSISNAKKLAYKALRKGTAMQAMAGAIDRCQQFRKSKVEALIALGDIPNRYQNPVADLVGLKRRLIAQRKLMNQRDLGAKSDPVDPPDVLFAACYLAVVLRAMVVRRFHHITRLIINNKTELQRQKATAVMSHLRMAFQLRKRRMFATFRQNTAGQAAEPIQPTNAVLDAFQYPPPTASLPVLVDKATVRVPDYYTRLMSVRESAALKAHYLPVEQENPRTTYRTRRSQSSNGPSAPFNDGQSSKDMGKRPLPELVRPKADVRVDKRVRDLASSH